MKRILFALTIFLLPMLVCAQEDYVRPASKPVNAAQDKPESSATQDVSELSFAKRLTYGGNLGLAFGDFVNIDISPMIGYRTTNKWVNGLGVTYQYFEDRRFSPSIKSNIVGGRLFTRHTVYNNIFAHSEYELLKLTLSNSNRESIPAHWYPALFVGGGVFQGVGSRNQSGFIFMAMYNLLHKPGNTLYWSPWQVRVGFMI